MHDPLITNDLWKKNLHIYNDIDSDNGIYKICTK